MTTNSDNGSTTFPGIDLMNKMVNTYVSSWRKQVDALNTFWGDVTSADADNTTWLTSYSKLLHAYTDSIKSSFGMYTGSFAEGTPYNCPVVPFALDKSNAESSAASCVPISSKIDTTKIVTPRLTRSDGAQLDAKHLIVTPDPDGCHVNISIGFLTQIPLAQKSGDYFALVYSAALPTPRLAIALVVVHWINPAELPAP